MLHFPRAATIIAAAMMFGPAASGQGIAPTALTAEAINGAMLQADFPQAGDPGAGQPIPEIVRLQVLLDRAGASPGVIDGFDGENVRKAIRAFEAMHDLPVDGALDAQMLALLDSGETIIQTYVITPDDAAGIVTPLPDDYAELAKRDYLGYTSVAERLAERFHMDADLLDALNPGVAYAVGETIHVAHTADVAQQGKVARIEADKTLRQLRAYDAQGALIAAYPATIGSEDNPSPEGEHTVVAVVLEPDYTYNPDVNFQQGDNTEPLKLPPGPNGPVGSIWIDLSEPTYGIHGSPEPAKIDKVNSHGCVRLTNWDARELAAMVEKGVTVSFLS